MANPAPAPEPMTDGVVIPRAVVAAIWKAWPDQAGEILAQLHHSRINGCFYFERWGMYVGVEDDGYIHT